MLYMAQEKTIGRPVSRGHSAEKHYCSFVKYCLNIKKTKAHFNVNPRTLKIVTFNIAVFSWSSNRSTCSLILRRECYFS